MSDSNSPKAQDQADQHEADRLADELKNGTNNEPNYVAGRLVYLCSGGRRLPFGSQWLTLVVDSRNPGKNLSAGPGNKGVIAIFEDFETSQKGSYLVETDGLNGVVVTNKVADLMD